MSESEGPSAPDAPSRFQFGSMALSEEQGRGIPSSPSAANGEDLHSGLVGQLQDPSTLNEAIAILRMIVLNEQFSPEILPYQLDTVETMRQLVTTQTDLVDAEEDDDQVDQLSFESQLKRMELDRINYQLRHYFRLRIKKIEKFIMHIFKRDGPYDRLSEPEKRFAVGYSDLVEDHFKKSFLSMLPQRLQIMEKDGNVDFATEPPLDNFVFCHVRNTVGSYVVGEEATDDSLDLTKGDTLCIRYKSIRELLKNEDVELF